MKQFNWNKWIVIYAALALPMHYFLAVTPWVYFVWTYCLLYTQFLLVEGQYKNVQRQITDKKSLSESQGKLKISPTLSGYVGETVTSWEPETEIWNIEADRYVKADDLDKQFREVSNKIDAKLLEIQAMNAMNASITPPSDGVTFASLRDTTFGGVSCKEAAVGLLQAHSGLAGLTQSRVLINGDIDSVVKDIDNAYSIHGNLANLGRVNAEYQNSTESMSMASSYINQGIITNNGIVPITDESTMTYNPHYIDPVDINGLHRNSTHNKNFARYRDHVFNRAMEGAECVYCGMREMAARGAEVFCKIKTGTIGKEHSLINSARYQGHVFDRSMEGHGCIYCGIAEAFARATELVCSSITDNTYIPAPAEPISENGEYAPSSEYRGHNFKGNIFQTDTCKYCGLQEGVVRAAQITCCKVKKGKYYG